MTRLLNMGMTVIAASLVPVAVVSALGLAPLSMLLGLIALVVAGRRRLLGAMGDLPVVLIGALALWSLIGAGWAPDPGQSIKTALRLLVSSYAGWLALVVARDLDDAVRARLWRVLGVTLAVGLLVLTIDYLSDKGFSEMVFGWYHGGALDFVKSPFNRAATIMIMLVWPVGLALWRLRHRRATFGLCALGLLTLVVSDSGSMKAAGLAGALFLLLALWRGRVAFTLLRGALVAVTLAIPAVIYQFPPPEVTFREWLWLPHSSHHRVTIWSFVSQRIAEHPLRGWGLDASRDMPGGETYIHVYRPDSTIEGGVFKLGEQLLPLHPHNAVLQWWLELGGVGVAFLLALFWVMLRRVERAAPDALTAAVWGASIVTGLTVAAVSYGFWQSWWVGAMWIIAALAAQIPPRLPSGA